MIQTQQKIPPANRYFVQPYKTGSRSAKALSVALSGLQLRLHGSKFKPATHRKVVNWGHSGGFPDALNGLSGNMLAAGNKLTWFNLASTLSGGPRVPEFCTNRTEAAIFLLTSDVVSRTILNGHSGSGIVINEKGSDPNAIPDAPLYVKYIPKDGEYRIHIFRTGPGEPGAVIDIQKKIRDPNKEPTTWKVRSHQNGFMFVRTGFETPSDVIEQARRAFQVSGLDFAAVDVIWNKHRNKAYVLELNTAPGLEGTSVEIYASAVKRYFGE